MLAKLFSRFFFVFFIFTLGTSYSFGMQPHDNLIPQDIDSAYFLIKRTFQTMIDTGNFNPTFYREDDGRVDLFDCQTGSSFLYTQLNSKQNLLAEQLADVAFRIVALKWKLIKLDYPSELWHQRLIMIEKRQRKMVANAYASSDFPESYLINDSIEAIEQLALLLNDYRATKAKYLSPVWVEGGCGAGEVGINISVIPRNGRIWLIPTFDYELCSLKNIDPFDMDRCPRWREHIKGLLFDVAGDYRYYAIWPDGFTRKGVLTFTDVEHGQTIVISQDRYQNREKKAHGIDRNR